MSGRSRIAMTCQLRGRGADPQPIRAPPPMTRSRPPLHCSMITASFGRAAELIRILDLRNMTRRRHARPIGIAQECSSYNRASRSFHSQPYRMPRLRPPWLARRSRLRPQPPKPKAGMQSSSLNVSLCFSSWAHRPHRVASTLLRKLHPTRTRDSKSSWRRAEVTWARNRPNQSSKRL